MPHALSTVLGIDPDSPDARRALRQVDHDTALFDELIARRRGMFPDEDSFAAKVGWTPFSLRHFEWDPLDASLQDARSYAHALGVEVVHQVIVR